MLNLSLPLLDALNLRSNFNRYIYMQGGAVYIATGGSLDVAGEVTLERNSAVSLLESPVVLETDNSVRLHVTILVFPTSK